MQCEVMRTEDFALSAEMSVYVRNKLTRDGSDFQRRIDDWLTERRPPPDGCISLVWDQGEIIGWCRSETWRDFDTLEAFVASTHRGRGVASFAASGLVAEYLYDTGMNVAVFSPAMMIVAKKVGLWPELYEIDNRGDWVRA